MGLINQPRANNNQKYKTVKCKYFEQYGQCRYGDTCSFAHGDKDVRDSNEMMTMMNNQMGQFAN